MGGHRGSVHLGEPCCSSFVPAPLRPRSPSSPLPLVPHPSRSTSLSLHLPVDFRFPPFPSNGLRRGGAYIEVASSMEPSAKRRRLGHIADTVPRVTAPRSRDIPIEPSLNDVHDVEDDVFDPTHAFFEALPSAVQRIGPRHQSSSSDAETAQSDLSPWVKDIFPHFLPFIPSVDRNPVDLQSPNPFLEPDELEVTHPVLRKPATTTRPPPLPSGSVNGFLKFKFSNNKRKYSESFSGPPPLLPAAVDHAASASQHKTTSVDPRVLVLRNSSHVPPLPPNFGHVCLRGHTDRALFAFFLRAIVPGRTVIEGDNTYKTEIAPIAAENDLVKCCILSLAATYVLDFVQTPTLLQRAGFNHKKSMVLLTEELNKPDTYKPGHEVAVLAALTLLAHNEVVNWEIASREPSPKWYRASKKAEFIMSRTNPGYRYSKPINVQCTTARTQIAHLFCYYIVMSDCVCPLNLETTECSFSWLMNGQDQEQRTIVGMAGLSPKLTHFIAKITFLAGTLLKNPTAVASLLVAGQIEKLLQSFPQSSLLSKGYPTLEAMLAACTLNEDGKVTTAAEVTDLIAGSYVAAAQIYLQCRVFRRTRSHPLVQRVLDQLLSCITRQPTSGNLFTAQTPLYSVFVAGIVAYKPHHRDVVRNWFLPICPDARGNVPPAWRAMQSVWEWMDTRDFGFPEPTFGDLMDEDGRVADRHAWWEDLVAVLMEKEGRMNLS
ncbi:fungal-specific transcription factor domain-containing protein [Phialemonium atrogriseum]|uniref:Fungal-specific transcription factor domain-containing protein n=1 Tax=Phialemonium atrogriseum TaxID=1093897 RepID=A0AAJ0C1E5_9PEZI|nr:fungal-specific transcription factor domain-containing protein [Phialemonium atrogriseum]KAK1768160.1 fungal-specific transcription factor domain-containing protein [Phialemonium atrogriseum]